MANQTDRIKWDPKKDYQKGITEWAHQVMYQNAFKYIPEGSLVLDIGCGYGAGCVIFADKARKVVGIDIDQDVVNYAHRNEKTEIVFNYIEKFPEDRKFDVITLLAVIEHVDKPHEVIEKCVRMLNPNGKVIIYFHEDDFKIPEIEVISQKYGGIIEPSGLPSAHFVIITKSL